MNKFTIATVFGWSEEEVKRIENILDTLDKHGWNISINDIKQDILKYDEDIEIFNEWNIAIASVVFVKMCIHTKNYIISMYIEDKIYESEFEDALFTLNSWIDGSFEGVMLHTNLKIVRSDNPFYMFSITDFYEIFEGKVNELMEGILKF
jgi:hypothetical protein